MSRPLCVLVPEIGIISETFIRWDIRRLLPGGTVVIADPPPAGGSVTNDPAWDVGDCPALAFAPVQGDPPPSTERGTAVARFLADHGVETVLVEYLDFADRWLDLLLSCGVRVWLRGHGVDVSARLTQQRWRDTYRRYQAADGIIVPSTDAARALISLGLPSCKVHIVRYSVDLPSQLAKRPDGNVVRCVAVGRLVPKKAPLLLLDAFRTSAARDSRLTLDIVGDGPLMADVRSQIARYGLQGRVTLHGQRSHEDTLALIRSADVLLHHAVTSPVDGDTEGQPLAILEAMAASVPVIATDHAGIPEVVDDRTNGRLVPEHDTAGMAEALLDLAANSDERRRLGAAARATIAERHSHDFARRTLLSLFGLSGAPSGQEVPSR